MPEENYTWLRRKMLLSFEELSRLVRAFTTVGVNRVRLTGGEPLLRRDLPELVAQLKSVELEEIAITTNGVLLAKHQKALFQAGLDRVTVSLDAIDPTLFRKMSQRDDLDRVLEGISSVAGSPGLKLDSVIIKGVNDHQVLPLLEFGAKMQAEVRFIEYMDVGGATRWSASQVFSQKEILNQIRERFGPIEEIPGRGSAPAERFRTKQGQSFGVIASVSRPFCRTCDRARVTADGQLLTCLYGLKGRDLRSLLRDGRSDQELAQELREIWSRRRDRGAEDRLNLAQRGPLANVAQLQENVHLEMHTRGG